MSLGRKLSGALSSIGRKAYAGASLGRKLSEAALKYSAPVSKFLDVAAPASMALGPEFAPVAAGAAAASSALRKFQQGAKRLGDVSGRVASYGAAAQSGDVGRLRALGTADIAKTSAALERKEAARQYSELPEYSADLFH
jgi:hypothetical protein